jgi:TnpA family transposase
MSIEKLDASRRELIELYLQLDLPKAWGDGKTVAVDGTQYDFYEQNLLAGYHFRYRKMGAVAYRHVANNYIAYFAHFLPPGIKEAIYVIEGLLKSELSVLPDAVHSDTHGQTTTVFAFTYLLGIKLMPRIRNWKDLLFFRPSKDVHFRHIESLFSDPVNWALIERHWEDLMQVILSIHTGRISSAMLLRRLGYSSEKNKLFLAAQEVGRVIRTIYLLEWMTNSKLRREVTATTNIIESYNAFAKWLSFGGEGVIAENDPDEQQKRLRYNDLVASAVILHNVVDMSRILTQLKAEGQSVHPEDLNFLSPHLTSSVKRFGDYTLDMAKPPEPWLDDHSLPRKGPTRLPSQAVLPFVREA